MDVDGVFDYFFSNPVLAHFALLVCLFVSVLSPRLLIMGVGAFLGAVSSLIAAALFGLWSMATFPSLAIGTLGGLFVGWRRAGIDVNGPDHYKMVALHHAAYRNENLAKRFLDLSRPIDAPNKKGETPLYLAIHIDRDIPALNLPDAQRWLQYDNRAGIEIAQVLLDFGADPCLTDR